MLGAIFAPLFKAPQAKAGFFSSVIGGEAYANTHILNKADPDSISSSGKNSQTMTLLQANISSASIFEDKNKAAIKSAKDKETNVDIKSYEELDPYANLNIVSESAILPLTGPSGVSDGKDTVDHSLETSVYVVRKGDALSVIADMFGVSINTILWANDMKKTDKIQEGDVLFILPISGLEHTVTKGQTLEGIAKLYKADAKEIADYNGLEVGAALALGDKLMIPDAIKAPENDKPIVNLKASVAKDKQYYVNHPVQNLAGYYINPVPGYRKSQGIHDNNAVDLAISSGTPVAASAGGRVTLARNGYNGGFGNLVVISHPNGTETLYAHLSKISTSTGSSVNQGEVIGNVGTTGRSTGPHLHFEVHGARNPGADGTWAK